MIELRLHRKIIKVTMMHSIMKSPYRIVGVCVLLGTLPYVPMVTHKGFVMDDAVAVQRNPNVVADYVSIDDFMRRDFWGLELFTGTWTHKSFRPITTWTYRLGYLLHGNDSSGYHVASLILHAVCSFIVGLFGLEVFQFTPILSGLAALLFASHPVHTENVLYLVGRADILASVFYMLAIIVGTRTEVLDTPQLGNVFGLSLIAGLCKEIGFTAPLIAAGITAIRERRIGSPKFFLLVSVAIILMIWRHRYTNGTEVNMSVQDNPFSYETSRVNRWLSFAFVHAKYLQLLVWPLELCYDYSLNAIPIVRWIDDVRLLFSLSGYCAIFVGLHYVFFHIKRECERTQKLLICAVLILVPFLPASNIMFPVGTVIGERLLYTPSIGLVMLVCLVMERIYSKAYRIPIQGLMGMMILFYLIRTGIRVSDWQDGDTLFLRDGHRQTASSKTQFNLGITHMSNKDYDRAVAALIRCAAADPMSALPYWRIGQVEILRGNFTTAEAWLMEASTKFSATLMIKDEEIFHDIAVAVFQNKKIDRADFYLSLALEINPRFPKGLNNFGCLIASRDPKRAVEFLRKAVDLKPDHGLYIGNLGFMAQYVGDQNNAQVDEQLRVKYHSEMKNFRRDCVWEFVPAS